MMNFWDLIFSKNQVIYSTSQIKKTQFYLYMDLSGSLLQKTGLKDRFRTFVPTRSSRWSLALLRLENDTVEIIFHHPIIVFKKRRHILRAA